MKKSLLSIIATLALTGIALAQDPGEIATSYTTFDANDGCHVWVDSWGGISTPGEDAFDVTVHGNDTLDLVYASTQFVFTDQVCVPITINVRDIWLSALSEAYDVDVIRPFVYDPAVLEVDGCFDVGDSIVVDQDRRLRASRQIDSMSVILATDAPGDFIIDSVIVRSADAVLDGCDH